jgi:ABC-2 type transport system permease protein
MSLLLFGKLLRLLVKERMEYRGDFLLGALAQMISYTADYIVIWLFIQRFNTIAGWTWPEIALLYSLGLFTYAIGASFSFVQMRQLETEVKNGTFDSLLIKPVNAYFYLVCRGFNIAYIAHILVSGSVMVWALQQLDISWSPAKILFLLAAIIGGAMIQAAIMSCIGALSFIWVRTGFMFTLFFKLKDFTSYPLPIFGSVIQLTLTFIVPLAFVNYFPAAILLSRDTLFIPSWAFFLVPLAGPLCYWLAYRFWQFGANRYQGAGG